MYKINRTVLLDAKRRGLTAAELATESDVNVCTVTRAMNREKIRLDRVWDRIATPDDVCICAECGLSYKETAKLLGLSYSTIRNVYGTQIYFFRWNQRERPESDPVYHAAVTKAKAMLR